MKLGVNWTALLCCARIVAGTALTSHDLQLQIANGISNGFRDELTKDLVIADHLHPFVKPPCGHDPERSSYTGRCIPALEYWTGTIRMVEAHRFREVEHHVFMATPYECFYRGARSRR